MTQRDEAKTLIKPASQDRTQSVSVDSPPQGDEPTYVATHRLDYGLGLPPTVNENVEPDLPTRTRLPPFGERVMQTQTLQPGAVIKHRFQLVNEIGRGGMGVVYAARDLRKEEVGDRDSVIAIKLLSDDFKAFPEALRMLQQECRKAQTLAHPNIVTVYDFDRDEDTVYMTMEYLTGRSLKAHIAEQSFSPNDLSNAFRVVTGIVHGLQYAHQHGIIHSDLKPANIYITEKGVVKILDFGIARAVMESEAAKAEQRRFEQNPPQFTSGAEHSETVDLVALTPPYASLEMFQGAPPDPRDDIYALACITYQLLTGKHPFGLRSAYEALQERLVPERIKGLKERQWNALLRGLALERKNRTASAQEFLDHLLPKRKEPWKLTAAALSAMTLASAAYFMLQTPQVVQPSLFENPPPEGELSTEQRGVVDNMLEVAEAHLIVGRLISPPGGNALDEYNQVLELHPYDRDAIAGLRELLDKLADQVEIAMNNGDRAKARQLVQAGLNVNDKHPRLLDLLKKLKDT